MRGAAGCIQRGPAFRADRDLQSEWGRYSAAAERFRLVGPSKMNEAAHQAALLLIHNVFDNELG